MMFGGSSRYACSNQSLCSLQNYRASESLFAGSTDRNGNLYEHSVYELRLNPPNVEVDNSSFSDRTVLVVDSANRPGTLVEVVQCLTEMGLSIRKARVSSDGEWFVDEFIVDRVTDPKKLQAIKDVLSAGPAYLESQSDKNSAVTVFELAGADTAGLLHDIVALLENNNCAVQSVALWTHNKRVAAVIAVTDKWHATIEEGQALPSVAPAGSHADAVKSARLKQLLYNMLDAHHQGDAIVEVSAVRGPIHHERRLHQLLLREEELNWSRSHLAAEYEQQMSSTGGRPSTSSPPLSSSSLSDISSASSDTTILESCQPPAPPPLPPPSPPRPTYSIAPGPALTQTKSHVGRSNLSRVTGADHQVHQASAPCNGNVSGSPRSRSSSSSGSGVRGSGPQASTDGTSLGDLSSDVGSDLTPSGSSYTGTGATPHTSPDATHASATVPNPNDSAISKEGRTLGSTHTTAADTPAHPPIMSSSLTAIADLPGGAGMHAGMHAGAHAGVPLGHTTPMGCSSLSLPDTSPMQPLSPPPRSAVLATRQAANGAAAKPPLASSGASRRVWPAASLISAKACKPHVDVSRDVRRSYLVISISCKDRKKLIFDTLCTLADLDYDVYHASVDLESDVAHQEYYIRTRFGDSSWNVQRVARLKYMLEASLQRRHPRGVKVHIQSGQAYDLSALTGAWRQAGLWITRAKAEPYSMLGSKGSDRGTRFANTFYVLDRNGCAPDTSVLQRTCISQGGKPLLTQQPKQAKQAKQQQQQQEALLPALPLTPAPVTQCAPHPPLTHAPSDAELLQNLASCTACHTHACEHAVPVPLTASTLQCANQQQLQQQQQQQLEGGSAECALMCADIAAQQQSLPAAATQSSSQECASFCSPTCERAGVNCPACTRISCHPTQPQLPRLPHTDAEVEAAALGLPTFAGSVGEANGGVNGCSVGRGPGRGPCAVGGNGAGGVGGGAGVCAGGGAAMCEGGGDGDVSPGVCAGEERGVAITHGHGGGACVGGDPGAVPAACLGGHGMNGHEPSFAFAVMQRSSKGSVDTASSVASSS